MRSRLASDSQQSCCLSLSSAMIIRISQLLAIAEELSLGPTPAAGMSEMTGSGP